MTIHFVDMHGQPVEQAISHKLRSLHYALQNSGKTIQDALLWTTRNHFKTIYPDSKHYNPEKVQPAGHTFGDKPTGAVDIDVPGITRAYRDLDIRPLHSRYLTIPMHREAYGKKATSFSGTFVLAKKNGKKFIVRKDMSGLTFLYFLSEHVHQSRDERLMPSDETFQQNIASRVMASLQRTTI